MIDINSDYACNKCCHNEVCIYNKDHMKLEEIFLEHIKKIQCSRLTEEWLEEINLNLSCRFFE